MAVFPIRFQVDQRTLNFLIQFFQSNTIQAQKDHIPDETFFRKFMERFKVR